VTSCLPRFAACVIAGSLAGQPAWAEPAAPEAATQLSPASSRITLRDALNAAWQRATAAREAEWQRRRAEAERVATRRPWAAAPSLELNHRSDRLQRHDGQRETEVGIAIPLWLPGQRAARAATVEAEAAHAQAGEQAARLVLAGELREAAWQVALLQADAAQADAHAAGLAQLAGDVDRRVSAGDLARADSLAAHAERLDATAALVDTRQRLQAAQAQWTLLTGLTAPPHLPSPAVPADATLMLDKHPEWRLASQAVTLAQQRLSLVRHSRRDAPELTLGLRQEQPGRGDASQGSLAIGVRLPLGTDDRNRPLDTAALSELDLAQAREQRLRERLASDTASARAAQQAALQQLEAATQRARLLRERAMLIDKSFRAGETPLPDLLRAVAIASQADSAVARLTAALGLARARLEQSLGALP
jgi:outer membrane protein TolC